MTPRCWGRGNPWPKPDPPVLGVKPSRPGKGKQRPACSSQCTIVPADMEIQHDPFLSPEEQEIAARLASYSRKIVEMRKAAESTITEELTMQTPSKGTRPGPRPRSMAEDYRIARQVQRLLQGVLVAQMLLTAVLAAMSSLVLTLYMIGDVLGLVASFTRIQRYHSVCTAFNLGSFLCSVGRSLALLIALLRPTGSTLSAGAMAERASSEGGASGWVNASAGGGGSDLWPTSLLGTGVATGIVSLCGALVAAHVLKRPLLLYRYETVALDEASADARADSEALKSRKRDGSLRPVNELHVGPYGDAEEGGHGSSTQSPIQPLEAWLSAGEPGVAINVGGSKKVRAVRRRGRDGGEALGLGLE